MMRRRLGHQEEHFCGHCDTLFEVLGCFYHGCVCQQKKKVTSQILNRSEKRKDYDAERKQ